MCDKESGRPVIVIEETLETKYEYMNHDIYLSGYQQDDVTRSKKKLIEYLNDGWEIYDKVECNPSGDTSFVFVYYLIILRRKI